MAVAEVVITAIGVLLGSVLAAWLVAMILGRLPQWPQERDRVETARPDYTVSKDLVFRPPAANRWLNSLLAPTFLIFVAIALPFSSDTALDVVLRLLPAAAIPHQSKQCAQGA